MKRFLIQHIDRILIVLGLSFLLILSVRTLHNLADLAAVEAPQELRLGSGDLQALYTLNAGMNKPAILDRRGDALMEFSGWNSYADVDGVSADLWSHGFNIELDRQRNRAFLTWSSLPLRQSDPQERRMRRYQLEQVVTLEGSQAVVEYYIIPNEPVRDARLTVGLYHWYYHALSPSKDGFVFSVTDLTRLEAEERLQPRRYTPARVAFLTTPEGVRTLTNEFGVYAIESSYRLHAPRLYERTLLARMSVAVSGETPGGH
ncbi:MAG TPA: hypothetical protein VJT32_14375 [bacterium]|nr:hypothetical protein [bacterium]